MAIRVGTKKIIRAYLGTKKLNMAWISGENILPGRSAIRNKQLYMVVNSEQALYIVDTVTGVARRINAPGVPFRFARERPFITGITFIEDTLYAVDRTTRKLYTLDRTTGRLTDIRTQDPRTVFSEIPYGLASIGNTLYTASDTALFSINSITGHERRVTVAGNFGIGEAAPYDLTSIDNILYLIGRTNDTLYTVNISTGVATRIGSSTSFGVNEMRPTGLGAVDNTLYMVGVDTKALHTVNRTTSVATRIGSADEFRNNITIPGSLSYLPSLIQPRSPNLYMTGTVLDRLISIDSATGIGVSNSDSVQFGVNELNPSGLALVRGTLYMAGSNTILYQVHPTTGDATRVGDRLRFRGRIRSPSALGNVGTNLYMAALGSLYNVNTTNSSTTEIFSIPNDDIINGIALLINPFKIYLINNTRNALYSLDGNLTNYVRVGTATNFDVNETDPKGLAVINNTLYMVGTRNDALYTLDRDTGIATRVSSVSSFGIRESFPTGLAPAQ